VYVVVRPPVASVIPISDPVFFANGRWSDHLSMAANNTSSFNYRVVAGTSTLSAHATGRAIDINPAFNPYIRGADTEPPGAVYDPTRPGTLTATHPVTRRFLELGWTWGGDFVALKDYQHFEK
jgi:hypothetical protein